MSRYFFLTNYSGILLKQFICFTLVASESIACSAFSLVGYWLRSHRGKRNNCFSKKPCVSCGSLYDTSMHAPKLFSPLMKNVTSEKKFNALKVIYLIPILRNLPGIGYKILVTFLMVYKFLHWFFTIAWHFLSTFPMEIYSLWFIWFFDSEGFKIIVFQKAHLQ